MRARFAPLSLATCKWLGERAHGLDVPLHAHVAQDEQRRAHGCFSQGRIARDEERDTKLGLDTVTEKVDYLDVEVGYVKVARDCQARSFSPAGS